MPRLIEIERHPDRMTLAHQLISQVTDEYDAKLKMIEEHAGRIAECAALAAKIASTGVVSEMTVKPVVTVHTKGIIAAVHVFHQSIGTARTAIRCAGLKIRKEEPDESFGDMTFSIDGLDCSVIADRGPGDDRSAVAA